jgi:predicted RecB family nuclease
VVIATPSEPRRPAIEHAPVVTVNGVGTVRGTQLNEVGIETVGALARTTPADLVRLLDFPPQLAEELVTEAKNLLRAADTA